MSIVYGSVYSLVFTTLSAKSERKRRKSENDAMSKYPFVQKSFRRSNIQTIFLDLDFGQHIKYC